MYFVPNETKPDQTIIKAVVLGNTEVGKTSLCNRFYLKKWDPLTAPTISASCLRSEVRILDSDIQFCIWDTAGEERYKSVTHLYYRNSHIAIIVVDLTAPQSLESASDWINEVKEHGPANVPFIIFGNKADLKDRIALDSKTLNEFAQTNEAEYIQVSALTGLHVDEAFYKAAQLGLEYFKRTSTAVEQEVSLVPNDQTEQKEKKKGCC